ncbi:ferrichrome porin FhuA [Enterobacter sp.]|uniref:ferrichrome porin FhuA n=1 Tax=Enterobacter sp. TaxID=42895 RepID=UPI0031D46CD8
MYRSSVNASRKVSGLSPLFVTLKIALLSALTANTVYAEDSILVSADAEKNSSEDPWGATPGLVSKKSATGTKTSSDIKNIPQSISVITRKEIDILQPKSLKDVLGYTPGVTVSDRGSSNAFDMVKIRGFSSGQGQNNYLDGLKLTGDNWNEMSTEPYLLERIEVLRGPASVLYGMSNPGGIVSMVSKRPVYTPVREVQFKMGSNNLMQTGFDFGDTLDDMGVYAFRITGMARSSDEEQSLSRQRRFAIAPSFTWRPDENTTFTFLSNIQNEPEVGYYGWMPRQGTLDPLPDGARLPDDFDDSAPNNTWSRYQRSVGYSFERVLSDNYTFRQNLRYSRVKTSQQSVYGRGICSTTDCPDVPSADLNHTISRGQFIDNERMNSFSVDTQLESDFHTANIDHTLLSGIDYRNLNNDISNLYGSATSLDLYNPEQNDFAFGDAEPYAHDKTRQTGIYVQDQAQYENWLLTLGGRYDWSRQETYLRQTNTGISRNDHQFTWRSGLNYLFDNGITPYISYSQSFEPNSFGLSSTPPVSYAPSRGEQYEAGVRYVPHGRSAMLSAAVYQLTKTHNLTTDPDNPLFKVAAGEIEVQGIELEAKAGLTDNLNLISSYSYTHAEYTKDTQLKGKTPDQVPDHQASLWLDYTFSQGALNGLTLGSGGRFIGSSWGDSENTFKVGSVAVWNGLVSYELSQLGLRGANIALNVTNILDRKYVSSCFADYGCFRGAGRQMTATATFHF